MIQNNRYDFNRPGAGHRPPPTRPIRPLPPSPPFRPLPPIHPIPLPPRPPIIPRFILAVFATRRSAEAYFRILNIARIHAEIIPFSSRQFFGRQFAVRINFRDKFLAQRLMTNLISADFLGWFDF